MHISLSPPSSPPEVRARRALLEADLAWLREELSGAKSPEQKASILYQLGVLEQLAGRDSLAVRQLLAAVNTVAHFKEPLERLIVLIERHRSFKNLPTLLEHLCRTAEGPEELARAHLAHAWCLLSGREPERALPSLEHALTASPRDPAALLTLELWARRHGNEALLQRALAARLAEARVPGWAALLGMELAELEATAGRGAHADELLRNAASLATPLASVALERRFELARRAGRTDWMIESLEARAARIVLALGSTEPEAAALVPRASRDLSLAVGLFAMQAELERGSGRDAAALATLQRARQIEPEQPWVAARLIDQAERMQERELLEELTLAELATEPTAAEAAALWLRLAESRAASGASREAMEALHETLALEPRCWLAHARELDLALGLRDGQRVATALSQIARELTVGEARGRYWLLAADAWARQAGSAGQAREALAQAEDAGVPRVLARRVERALAHQVADREWYDAATRRLLETDVDDVERVGLELESWRSALLAGQEALADERLTNLDATRAGRRVARLARAYAPEATDSRDALALLAEEDVDPSRSAALGWALGLRLHDAGNAAGAVATLTRFHARFPKATAIAGTLSAWLRERGDPLAASEVLRATAAALGDDPFASSLAVEAGLACWWAGDRDAALRDFELAEGPGRNGRSGVIGEWTRRAATQPTEPRASSDPDERLLAALERATATAAPSVRDLNDLNAALRGVGDAEDSGIGAAAHLANLVLSRALGVRVDPNALERASSLHADFGRLASCFRFLEQIGQPEPSPRALEENARRWSDENGGLVAALEWLGASARLGQRRVETAARERVSELLGGTAAEHARAAAALVTHLTQAEDMELLQGNSAVTRLTNLELSPPGCDPRRRAQALDDVGDLLGADADPILSLLRGYNQLAAADVEAAIGSFRRYTDAFPDDPSGWEGLLAAARRGDDPALLAEAAATLGSTCRDPAHGARLFEEAAEVFFERLDDEVAGQAALTRAVALDISRTSSFSRLLAALRGTGSPQEIAALIERRLPVASNTERVELSYELARARRQQEDLTGALAALDVVTDNDPDHLGAMALYGEIFITLERYPEAVERLARIATRTDAPAEYRVTGGLAAADLCEDQLGMSTRALEILSGLDRAGLGSLALRERLARSAARAGASADAAALFERLMFERETPAERAEAARLALAIRRDDLGKPGAAGPAAKVLLELMPNDPEAIDLVLSGALSPELTRELLGAGKHELVRSTSLMPTDVDALRRLARIAEQLGDIQLRQATLGALVALGHGLDASRAELVSLERRISTMPPASMSSDVLAGLADPDDNGPVPELLSFVAPYLAETFGPPRQAFSVSRRERVSELAGEPLRDEISAWVAAFGLSGFDLYLSPMPSERLVVLGTDPLTIIAGASVTAPLGPFQRLALARALYAQKRGLVPLLSLDDADVRALVAALCSVAGVSLSGPAEARQRDFERMLAKALPRKLRKLLPERARSVRDTEQNLDVWVRAAGASLDRVAAVAVGDASVILADAPAREQPSDAQAERARRLLGFMLSPEFETLRQRFGVSIR